MANFQYRYAIFPFIFPIAFEPSLHNAFSSSIFHDIQQEQSPQDQKSAKQCAEAPSDPSLHPKLTVEDILKACKGKLTENALSKEYWMIPTEGNSEAKYDYVAETRNFVLSSVESKGRSGSLYLCGRPGTGKVCYCIPCLQDSRLLS